MSVPLSALMPYAISESGGRFTVTSSKGKKWKTTYPTMAAAKKAVAYVESRFAGGSGPSAVGSPPSAESPDTSAERKKLGIPLLEEAEEGW